MKKTALMATILVIGFGGAAFAQGGGGMPAGVARDSTIPGSPGSTVGPGSGATSMPKPTHHRHHHHHTHTHSHPTTTGTTTQ